MSARRNPYTMALPVDVELIKAVRATAAKRGDRDGGWADIRDNWSDQDIQQVVGKSTTARGAIWQVAQAVKELRSSGPHFVVHGSQMDQAVKTTVDQAKFEQACRQPSWTMQVPFAAWVARQPLALPVGAKGRKAQRDRARRQAKRQPVAA